MKRVLGVVMVMAGILGAGSFAASPAEAAPEAPSVPDYYAVTISMHDFNMCSKDCDPGNYLQARDLVVWMHGVEHAWALSLNEACRADMIDIVNRTGLAGGNMGYQTRDHSGCNGNTASLRDFGNSIIRSGSTLALAERHQFPTQNDNPCDLYDEDHHCRNFVCVGMSSYAGQLNVCSGHLDKNRSIAKTQANEYIYIVNAEFPTGGKFMMGDFNNDPSEIPTVIYNQYWRAPQALTYEATAALRDEQLDYIWHDKAHTLSQTLLSPTCDDTFSDHCYVRARIT
jgi:endonuclease/exonuclease/phosphatase family metal-dependent hydrolase